MQPSEEVDVEVTREDQKRINQYGRLNARLHEIEREILRVRELKSKVEDAVGDALMIEEDDDEVEANEGAVKSSPLKYSVGECFFDVSLDRANTLLERDQERIEERLDALATVMDDVKERMLKLKTILKSKFRDSIQLEDESHVKL